MIIIPTEVNIKDVSQRIDISGFQNLLKLQYSRLYAINRIIDQWHRTENLETDTPNTQPTFNKSAKAIQWKRTVF